MAQVPTVVRLRRKRNGPVVQDCDVYIGRRLCMGGWNLHDSPWRNPFRVDRPKKKYDGTREEVLIKYEEYLRSQPQLMASLPTLAGQRLGCWCKPQDCHGDVLVKVFCEIVST